MKKVKEEQGLWDGLPICVVGTKADKPADERAVAMEEGKCLAKKLGAIFAECSAKEGEGCNGLVTAILKDMKVYKEKLKSEAAGREKDKLKQERREEKKAENSRKALWRRVLARLRG